MIAKFLAWLRKRSQERVAQERLLLDGCTSRILVLEDHARKGGRVSVKDLYFFTVQQQQAARSVVDALEWDRRVEGWQNRFVGPR